MLVPMLVAGLTPGRLRRSRRFAPLYLGEFELFDGTDPVTAAARVCNELECLEAKLATFETPLGRLCRILGERLEEAKLAGLREVARRLTISELGWHPGEERTARYAELIARRFVRGDLGDFKGLDEVLDVLVNSAGLRTDRALDVVKLLGPMWVNADAAGSLPVLARRSPRGAAAINGDLVSDFTAMMYLQRAYPLSSLWECVHLRGGSGPWSHVEQFAEGVRSGFRELAGVEDWPSAQTDKYIAKMSNPCFVLLPPPQPDGDTLKRLRGRFPTVTFVLNTGPQLPRRPSRPVHPLMPPVDLDREWEAFEDVRKTTSIAEKR